MPRLKNQNAMDRSKCPNLKTKCHDKKSICQKSKISKCHWPFLVAGILILDGILNQLAFCGRFVKMPHHFFKLLAFCRFFVKMPNYFFQNFWHFADFTSKCQISFSISLALCRFSIKMPNYIFKRFGILQIFHQNAKLFIFKKILVFCWFIIKMPRIFFKLP